MKRSINTPYEEMKFIEPIISSEFRQPMVQYQDGGIKKIGERRTYLDLPDPYIVKTKNNDVYLVEKPRQKKRGRKKRTFVPREDQNQKAEVGVMTEKELAKQWIQFQRENRDKEKGQKKIEFDSEWKRIESVSEVPETFYMLTPFKKQLNKDNIPSDVPLSPYHLFRLFFDDRVYKLIVRETNNMKRQSFEKVQYDANNKGIEKKIYQQPDFTELDLDGYLSILISMGINKMRQPKDYWQKKNFIHSEIACMMKENKFRELDRCLNLADSTQAHIQQDIIGKVREYIDYLNDNFKKYYYPGEYLSIDEGMIPFTGKVAFKVFNPDKPDKYGIKEFVLCDARNAYTLETQLYSGNHQEENCTEFSLSKTNEVVMHLLKDYGFKQHKVVMDNYYNSPGLFYVMKQYGFGALGTMRIPRLRLPSNLFEQILEVHQNKTLAYLQGDINLAIFFRGTNDKEISMMSNFIDQRTVEDDVNIHFTVQFLIMFAQFWKILADIKESRPISKEQTQISAYYNKFKGGVDKRNGFLAAYRNMRRNHKWWKAVFYRLMDNAIVNAFILYNFNKSPKFTMAQKDFRICLFKQLAARYSPPKREIAIKELNLMKYNTDQADEQYNYFDIQIQTKILEKCDYSSHQLVKSKTKLKACVECSILTSFFCNTCSKIFGIPIPICASGFNQCYDVHASRERADVAINMRDKKRVGESKQMSKSDEKQVRKLIKLEQLIDDSEDEEQNLFDNSTIFGQELLFTKSTQKKQNKEGSNELATQSQQKKFKGKIVRQQQQQQIVVVMKDSNCINNVKGKSKSNKCLNFESNKDDKRIEEHNLTNWLISFDNKKDDSNSLDQIGEIEDEQDDDYLWIQKQFNRMEVEDIIGIDKAVIKNNKKNQHIQVVESGDEDNYIQIVSDDDKPEEPILNNIDFFETPKKSNNNKKIGGGLTNLQKLLSGQYQDEEENNNNCKRVSIESNSSNNKKRRIIIKKKQEKYEQSMKVKQLSYNDKDLCEISSDEEYNDETIRRQFRQFRPDFKNAERIKEKEQQQLENDFNIRMMQEQQQQIQLVISNQKKPSSNDNCHQLTRSNNQSQSNSSDQYESTTANTNTNRFFDSQQLFSLNENQNQCASPRSSVLNQENNFENNSDDDGWICQKEVSTKQEKSSQNQNKKQQQKQYEDNQKELEQKDSKEEELPFKTQSDNKDNMKEIKQENTQNNQKQPVNIK